MCPPGFLWPSRVYVFILFGVIFDFQGLPGLKSIKAINQFLVHSLQVPSLHYFAEIGPYVPRSLKQHFWTVLGSVKRPGSLKVPYRDMLPYLYRLDCHFWRGQINQSIGVYTQRTKLDQARNI